MFNEMSKIEEMMVDFCEYNPLIFAQKSASKQEECKEQKYEFSYLKKFYIYSQAISFKKSIEFSDFVLNLL